MAFVPVPLLLIFVNCLFTLQAQYTGQNPCTSKETCHECIRTPSCAWCYQHIRDHGDQPRCFQPASPSPLGGHCPSEFTYFPGNVLITLENQALSRPTGVAGAAAEAAWAEHGQGAAAGAAGAAGGAAGAAGGAAAAASGHIVQVGPQRLHLKLRERESHSFSMYYTQAKDYPVDLYYLMDLSKSMEDDKDKLSLLGNLLADSMRNITSNFRLGFGSFVDKVVMPYVSTIPKKLKQPCSDCVAPYGFRNHMTLSNNTSRFSHMVRAASVSGNLDAPEGGFDAIMQAIVCEKEIGWRKDARKLLVFSTDAGFHYAGDGKLGGIIKPNDGQCHLNSQGMYSHSTIQDYPSIAQINHKVKQHTVNVIFAVTGEQYSVYEKLKGFIEGATSGELSADSSNIVELIKGQYKKISSVVELTERNKPEYVKIKYFTRCMNESEPLKETSKCAGVRGGNLIQFKLEILLEKCPENPSEWNQTFEIKPVGIDESLTIDLEMLCSCPCEFPGDAGYIRNAPECNGVGTYKCGICECDELHFGNKCECSVTGMYHRTDTQGCKNPNTNDTLDCSGHGDCVCNRCECEIRPNGDEFYGTWCECNDFSCPRHEGKLCGGHGKCVCGECKCDEPWTGAACPCHNVTDTCYPPLAENPEICSGNGECVCGSCVCNTTKGGRYFGKFCDRCPGCHDRCDEFRPCVQCQLYKGGGPITDEDECVKTCKGITPVSVDVVQAIEENDENLCAGIDQDDCRYAFVYWVKDGKVFIRAQEQRECPVKVYLLGIVLGVIALVVLMGLAILLLWKLLTTIHDRKEFARFEKERMMAKWDTGENPIYKQATSTFKNPTYAGKG